jgi:competence protein ComEC
VTRVLPAHVLAAALALGLAASNAVRLGLAPLVLVAAVGGLAIGLAAPRPARLAAIALLGVCVGWWWGDVRLDALDRSPLRVEADRSARALVEVTGEPRVGQFGQRLPGRVRRFGGRTLDERVQLDLPLGRAPPQGTLVSVLAVVRLPRTAVGGGFDERAYLRRQGVHVVLRIDEWHVVGRPGGLGGLADGLRRWLRRALAPGLTGERRAVLEGVVLGDDNGLSPSLQTSFRRSGLYHLLAVSGQNVVLLAGGVLALATLLGVGTWRHWRRSAATCSPSDHRPRSSARRSPAPLFRWHGSLHASGTRSTFFSSPRSFFSPGTRTRSSTPGSSCRSQQCSRSSSPPAG